MIITSLLCCTACLSTTEERQPDSGAPKLVQPRDSGVVSVDECEGHVRFYWLGTTLRGAHKDIFGIKAMVPFDDDWFVLPMHGDGLLRGRRTGTEIPPDALQRTARGLRAELPWPKNDVVLTKGGIAVGCALQFQRQSLGGPYQAELKDVRTGWTFDVVHDGGVVLTF